MNDTEQQDPFLEKAKQNLDQSIESLDLQTQMALDRVRREALQQSSRKKLKWQWTVGAPAGGLVTAGLVAALWLGNPAVTPQKSINNMQDLELLSSEEDLELMEDIEFVA